MKSDESCSHSHATEWHSKECELLSLFVISSRAQGPSLEQYWTWSLTGVCVHEHPLRLPGGTVQVTPSSDLASAGQLDWPYLTTKSNPECHLF